MSTIAIIGTAGRGADGKKLSLAIYEKMLVVAQTLIQNYEVFGKFPTIISGGAAWSDHLAVSLFLEGIALKLKLYLPCKFDKKKKQYHDTGVIDWKTNPGGTSNYYHKLFSDKIGRDSLEELANAIEMGAEVVIGGGMFDRNALVAKEATHVISFTFGDKEVLADGGTANTMLAYLKNREAAGLSNGSYHVDLNTMKVHGGAKVIV